MAKSPKVSDFNFTQTSVRKSVVGVAQLRPKATGGASTPTAKPAAPATSTTPKPPVKSK